MSPSGRRETASGILGVFHSILQLRQGVHSMAWLMLRRPLSVRLDFLPALCFPSSLTGFSPEWSPEKPCASESSSQALRLRNPTDVAVVLLPLGALQGANSTSSTTPVHPGPHRARASFGPHENASNPDGTALKVAGASASPGLWPAGPLVLLLSESRNVADWKSPRASRQGLSCESWSSHLVAG